MRNFCAVRVPTSKVSLSLLSALRLGSMHCDVYDARGVLGPLSGDDSCKPLVQFKGWLECLNCFRTPITTQTNEI